MTRVVIGLIAVLSICVAAAQTGGDFSPGMTPGGDSDPRGDTDSFVDPAGLVGVLQLNEGQRMRLQSLNHEYEDEVFPLIRDSWEKEWELRRLGRSQDSDTSKGEMLVQEVEMLYEQIRGAGDRHRERARALLSSQQISALDKIEEAIELTRAAVQAVCANLIATPDLGGPESDWIPKRLFGVELGFDSCGVDLGIPPSFGGVLEVEGKADAVPIDRANP